MHLSRASSLFDSSRTFRRRSKILTSCYATVSLIRSLGHSCNKVSWKNIWTFSNENLFLNLRTITNNYHLIFWKLNKHKDLYSFMKDSSKDGSLRPTALGKIYYKISSFIYWATLVLIEQNCIKTRTFRNSKILLGIMYNYPCKLYSLY